MLKRLAILLTALAVSSLAQAGDFDNNQINLKVKTKDYGIEFRDTTKSSRSHIQLEKYVGDWEFAYRYDEQIGKTEHRPRITYKLFENEFAYVKPRVEYRYFEGTTDDYFRVRSAFGLKMGGAYAEITPMLHYGQGKTDDMKIDEYQAKVGYNWKINEHTKLNTYVQRDADNHFDKTNLFLGTALEFNF